jgi:hypothetical protein
MVDWVGQHGDMAHTSLSKRPFSAQHKPDVLRPS